MTDLERGLFLPDWNERFVPCTRQTWVDAKALSEEAWLAVLCELQPTVIVTAWSCPVIPFSWASASDCPLRYVCSVTGSVKPRVSRALLERGVLVSNWGNLISHTIAEHALLMVLSCLRNVQHWSALIDEPQTMFAMMPLMRTRSLRGKRVGLHGFGAIARELVVMLRPHQVEIAAHSDGVPAEHFADYGVKRCGSLAALFADSDVLIECEGLNDRSAGSVTEALLRSMPSDAVFINIARGMLVEDERALARLADEGRLRVALDVFHTATLPSDAPLRLSDNVLLSPHVAGPTWDTYPLLGQAALENISRYLDGQQPERLVTLEAYDRAT
ncbi:NAD(P)-dependent oxidoreductase [Cerasicoccus maritimus]|uniref:NAD(P)-dependent oxidoreductase n=1 Tax=Cerasicoccus maritimus TaxID=490089 RepID=UPI00285289E1|nr:NAD(P)-dependent oxidoreductase [Cerasicoccus maritimus]